MKKYEDKKRLEAQELLETVTGDAGEDIDDGVVMLVLLMVVEVVVIMTVVVLMIALVGWWFGVVVRVLEGML